MKIFMDILFNLGANWFAEFDFRNWKTWLGLVFLIVYVVYAYLEKARNNSENK